MTRRCYSPRIDPPSYRDLCREQSCPDEKQQRQQDLPTCFHRNLPFLLFGRSRFWLLPCSYHRSKTLTGTKNYDQGLREYPYEKISQKIKDFSRVRTKCASKPRRSVSVGLLYCVGRLHGQQRIHSFDSLRYSITELAKPVPSGELNCSKKPIPSKFLDDRLHHHGSVSSSSILTLLCISASFTLFSYSSLSKLPPVAFTSI